MIKTATATPTPIPAFAPVVKPVVSPLSPCCIEVVVGLADAVDVSAGIAEVPIENVVVAEVVEPVEGSGAVMLK